MSSLVVNKVRKTWLGAKGLSVEAIRDVSLKVSSGEFVAILGPSGCGKSTLLELCAGLEKTTSGEIQIDGEPVNGPNPKAVMVFQEHSLFPWLDVEANVGFGPKMRGTRDPARVKEVLERVRLAKFARHYPHQLSGGMKQRVVMSAAPGRVLEEVTIALPRPRSMTDPAFNGYRVRLSSHMEREVMREMQEREVMHGAEIQ